MADSAPMTRSAAHPRRPWRRLAWAVLLGVPLLLLAALLTAGTLALQTTPLVAQRSAVATSDVQRALDIMRAHDPRRARPGALQMVVATEADLELLLNHAASRLLNAQGRVQLAHGTASVQASIEWTALPWAGWPGRWLNVQAQVQETGSLPVLSSLRLGRLPVPPSLAQWLLPRVPRLLGLDLDPAIAGDVLRTVKFLKGRVHVVYAWQGDTTARVLDSLVPPAERERLRVYAQRLRELTLANGPGWQVSLARLMGPMFALAQQRSADGGDAAAENRAALMVLTLFANGRSVSSVLPGAEDMPRPRWLRVTLAGRSDFPRHFLVSAALATESTSPLSKAVGLYKELADARGGSGFSFNDMAANLAGTRFGEAAVNEAEALQARVARGVDEASFMPATADLPEFLNEAEFRRRYGGVQAPAYREQLAEIESRVAGLPLFR